MDGQLNNKSAPIGDLSALWVLLALFAASVEPIMVKLGYRGGASPWQLLLYRYLWSAATMLVLARPKSWLGWSKLQKLLPAALLLACTNGMVLLALQSTSAVTVITVMTTTPAFVGLINHKLGREVLGTRFWLGFAACFVGVGLSTGALQADRHAAAPLGLFAVGVAVLSSTIYRTRMHTLTKELAPKEISAWLMLINASLASVLLGPWIEPLPRQGVIVSMWIGVAAALANLAFLAAIRIVGATRMSIFDMLQRPLVILLAALALGEPWSWTELAGAGLVLLGVQLAKTEKRPGAAAATPPSAIAVTASVLPRLADHRDLAGTGP